MSYRHTRVNDIETATKTLLSNLADTIETLNENDMPMPKVDGIPVSAQLAKFCAEIRKVNRHVKFGVSKNYRRHELHVYMDGQAYAMMKIGHYDYSVNPKSSEFKYMVYARMINNEKFRDDNDRYHMATAENIDRAMKNVKKYMRPYSPIECAEMTFDWVRSRFSSVVSNVSSELYDTKNDIISSAHLRNELFHMIDVGYEFLSEEFKGMIVKWRDKYREDQVSRGRALHAYYVNVRIHRDEMVCDVIEVLDAQKRRRLEPQMPVTTYKMEELPEDIAGNLAALSMVGDDHYVDGVGLRVDSATFWVQK
jgi:hypothetical protein